MSRRTTHALVATVAISLCLASCARPQERQAVSEGWLTRNADNAPQEEELVDPEVETFELALASTQLSLHVPTSYTEQEIEPEERRAYQVASYGSLDYLVDFDVYEIPKSVAPTLHELALELERTSWDGVATQTEIAGREAYTLTAKIAFDGYVYDTIALLAEDENAYVRVVFWLDHDFDLALLRAERMMSTLGPVGGALTYEPEAEATQVGETPQEPVYEGDTPPVDETGPAGADAVVDETPAEEAVPEMSEEVVPEAV